MTPADGANIALLLAFAVAAYAAVASVLGVRRDLPELVASARNGVAVLAVLITLAALGLLHGLLSHDYTLRYVYDHSSRAMPTAALVTSFWGGQQGSLLLWSWGLALLSLLVVVRSPLAGAVLAGRPLASQPPAVGQYAYAIAVLLGIQVFFLFILGFVSSPFDRLPIVAPDGRGLNPLLMDAGMRIHPPLLLTGYMSFSVPFAFAIAALATGRQGREWLRTVRGWMLLAWTIQGCGLLMGAWWAYHVLGWGGYWGWDPVENVALLPWLTATAFLHTIMVQERRGMLKVWTLALAITTFALAVFGTFVVRSGVLTSVHSFAQSTIGPYFFAFLGLVLIGSTALLIYRLPQLRAEGTFDALLSRETSFLLNNLLLVGIAAATFWGTVFPLVSEALRGTKVAVGAPFYQQVNGPLLVLLLLLMGAGPLLAWRVTSQRNLLRLLAGPVGVAVAVGVALFALGVERGLALLAAAACAFVVATVALEVYRGLRSRQRGGQALVPAIATLVARNRRRYGGYVVHLAMVLIAVGVLGSGHQVERTITLAPGQIAQVGSYSLRHGGLLDFRQDGAEGVLARLTLAGPNGQPLGTLAPDRRVYENWEQQPISGIAIQTTWPWLDDVYAVLLDVDAVNASTFHVFVNPLVLCIWLGGWLFLLGTLIAAWPDASPRPLSVRAAAAPREAVASEA
jgi:cytochrome c-type biogenesis protein CcmF